ncbi:hypothetical protein FLJC2902T_12780 [Flavobacterium limnosediminis JC2902]|uniref:Uncharacterized protein n=1 Tax=Flavobacterium limnosediminis JC2902 TaxID=1341181 RepID=V6SR87_9FLAO|nr:hypothetical protein FLJC2902T_12780 [Flavobacterium limnosediminis JC2902]
MAGETVLDSICSGTIDASLDQVNTTLEWNGVLTVIPTNDFKSILLEYAEFLQQPPLNGTRT